MKRFFNNYIMGSYSLLEASADGQVNNKHMNILSALIRLFYLFVVFFLIFLTWSFSAAVYRIKTTVLKKMTFPPQNKQNNFLLLMWDKSFLHHCIMVGGIGWSQKVLDFYHFGKILDPFWGGKFLFLTIVFVMIKERPGNLFCMVECPGRSLLSHVMPLLFHCVLDYNAMTLTLGFFKM